MTTSGQGQFLEGGSFDTQGNLWFVGIGSGWISYLQPDGKLVPVINCNPPAEIGQTCEPQGTRFKDGKLYLTTRHRGILVYDPQTKELKTLVYTWRNQLFKGPNDLDFDAEGNLYFTDPWATGPGPNASDRTGAVDQYSKDGMLRKIMDDLQFPNGIAVSPDNNTLAIGDCTAGRMLYAAFAAGPSMGVPGGFTDPQRLTFTGVKAGTYFPGNGCPDGIHYDVKGNLWAASARLGGMLQIDPRGIILGFVPIPNSDLATTNFAFGGPDNQRAFWSLTMYNEKQRLAANPIDRFAIGDRDKLAFNPDGSLDLYIQRESPGRDKELNWLPAPASGSFTMNLRLYSPKAEVLDGTWSPPGVTLVK